MKVIIESVGNVKGKIIEGIALTPAVSLNRNIYSIESIDSAKNLGVPLRADWEHTDEIIGSVVYSKGPNHSINYRAEINTTREIKEGITKVSIEASVDEVVNSCNRKGCYNLIDGITFEGIGLTENPGVQTTTLNIIESYQDWKPIKDHLCENCSVIENKKKETKLIKEDIISDIIKKMIMDLEERIKAKYDLILAYEAILVFDINNQYYKDELMYAKDDLRWMIDRYLEIKDKVSESRTDIDKIISELNFKDIPQISETINKIKSINKCSTCGKHKKV